MTAFDISNLTLIENDVLKGLHSLADGSVDLVITSPPYNIGKSYEIGDKRSINAYESWMREIIQVMTSKLSEAGAICWQVGNYVSNSVVVPLDYLVYPIFVDLGFKLRNRIVWQFNFGLHARQRLSGRYETLLWLTKSDQYTFNLDDIRVPQLYPGKRHSARKGEGRAGKLSGNPKGKNPSDYWEFSGQRYFEDELVWHLPNVKANHPEHTEHPCQFPVELAERCVLAFSNMGQTILDPFIGSGTTAVAALPRGRKVVGIDRDANYIKLTRERLDSLSSSELRVRSSGAGVRSPNPRERVARLPEEWGEGQVRGQAEYEKEEGAFSR